MNQGTFHKTGEPHSPADQFRRVWNHVEDRVSWPSSINVARELCHQLLEASFSNPHRDEITKLVSATDSLLDVLLLIHSDSELCDEVDAILEFIRQATCSVNEALNGESPATSLSDLVSHAHSRWGEYLAREESADTFDAWEESQDELTSWDVAASDEQPTEVDLPDQQIGLILGALAGSPVVVQSGVQASKSFDEPQFDPLLAPPEREVSEPTEPVTPFDDRQDNDSIEDVPAPVTLDLDQETIEAFTDDAVQCVSVIESEVLRYEQDPSSLDSLRQICRELHTIKGASAAIGLTGLASFLHRVEDSLEQNCHAAESTDVDVVLRSVDAVRSQLEVLMTAAEPEPGEGGEAVPTQSRSVFDAAANADSIRVNAGQLDRLFDMLAELVMLRNRRDSSSGQLKRINAELLHCVSRLRTFAEHSPTHNGTTDSGGNTMPISSLTEIASDLLELGRTLRQTIDPITEENLTLSRFINQFRSEVIELRRLPVQSLFTRLQRPIRDAAKAESKQVQVAFVNQQAGLERSFHEKLYEPLMHVVRNAVSHGIESPEEREELGKSPTGTITIEAHSGSNLFVVEVRDDGRGLDYEAVRSRAIERGLVSADEEITNEEIANLIFRPGFTTRNEISEISGRGVGMDVVAASVEALHGWVELESKKGEGTCLRLLVPRSSFIENAVVFRVGDQSFAFPTRFVSPFVESQSDALPASGIQLSKLLTPNSSPSKSQVPIRLESPDQPDRESVVVWVDEVVGTEEVVTRPLPPLMKTQRLFTGVTLSGA
ncbi:MAG: Hpt domain-containing protein, partial [Planctomycetales bacterium]|nr:Hpt domain-containing protein [Planctomycetales bacterium]